MSAYLIVEIEITNPENYEQVKKLTPATIEQFGGKYLARGGKTETLEGEWQPERLVILEFTDMERAKAWWNSPEYAPVKQLRQIYATTNMVLIEGNPVI